MLSEVPTSFTAFSPEDIYLPCEATGNPPPTYVHNRASSLLSSNHVKLAHSCVCHSFHWVKDRQQIRSGLHSGTLLAEEDEPLQQFEGHYRCYASNIYGTAMTQSVHVIVEGESHMSHG